jgi:hypothetical protein
VVYAEAGGRFSSITVTNAAGERVDTGRTRAGTVMQDTAGLAGVTMMVDPALGSVERDWVGHDRR